ncbi:Outer membrane protein beta-barrel domain-containing protein [Chryseolinea serpens]|uniref:Outer membrane protein beta-barrel domain-containing protein n=1 Tax=Chryseolinea serpens TaxID=947013 RepID=A0A1M5MC57_9BACT|nr:outer membrane beta-barrel protein [Chryseolinea serpens]SHG74890.1 Outer membrane protein beta-barrel domain-containing protein [Chryseolinea serpens]
MERWILILTILLLNGVNVVAQTAPTPPERYLRKRLISKFEVTAGGGLLRSSTYFGNSVTRFGYSFGGGVSHAFSKTLELKARVLYERKGSQTVGDGYGYGYYGQGPLGPIHFTRDITTTLNYLTISVMPTIHILPKKNVVFGMGAFYGFLRKAEVIYKNIDHINPANSSTLVLTDPRNFPSKYEYGFSGYAGYVLPLSKKYDLTFMLHYSKSLTDFVDFASTYQRNNVLLFSVTFGFLR